MSVLTQEIQPHDDPLLAAIMAHLFLFRLAGDQVFTEEEIKCIMTDYDGIRMIHDVPAHRFYFRLKPRISDNEKMPL